VKLFVTENDTKLETNIKNQGFQSLVKGVVRSSIPLGGTISNSYIILYETSI